MKKERKSIITDKLTTYLYYASVLFFFIGFNFQDSRTGGWVQQFMPASIGNAQINDITFVDSLRGFALTGFNSQNRSFILKTSNGGFNWIIKYSDTISPPLYQRLQFINRDTGYAIGDDKLYKTYNSGENWIYQVLPNLIFPTDLFVLNKDTMWIADPGSLGGGLYRTTNGGVSWQSQNLGGTTGNPNKIYMFNARIGFVSASTAILKTTNSGQNWNIVSTNDYFTDIYFIDTLNGFNVNPDRPYSFNKTTDGGITWQASQLPNIPGANNTFRTIKKFSYINDTLYGVYGLVRFNIQYRAIIYRTVNRGVSWGYQIPDTSYNIFRLLFAKFISAKKGWCYKENSGIYTSNGGDTTILASVHLTSNIVPDNYKLFQNYPNPFNSMTNVKFKMLKQGFAEIKVFDITGKLIKVLISQKLQAGEHKVIFDASNYTSGVYFYSLFIDGERIDTKKMILIK